MVLSCVAPFEGTARDREMEAGVGDVYATGRCW